MKTSSERDESHTVHQKKSKKGCILCGCISFVAVFVGLIVLAVSCLATMPATPGDYMTTTKTGGPIEAKYLAMGSHVVSYYEQPALMSFKKYEIYYPSDIAVFDNPLPAVVFVNGTGCFGSKYPALQKHLASWGFVTIATEEEHAWSGFSAEMSVRYLAHLNGLDGALPNGSENVFKNKIDINRIGISGHSQGGFGVVNAITAHRHKANYKAAVILSSNAQTNDALQWEADATQIHAPTLIVGSTGAFDAMLASLESLRLLYDQIPDDVPKVLARRKNADHGEMLYFADGYVTAWFMWLLQDDKEAAKAFICESPELMSNPLYQDQESDLGELATPDEAEAEKIRGMNGEHI